MTTNELRIGNHIRLILSQKETQVVCILDESIDTRHNGLVAIDGCAGIPLTEEWLIRFGFDKIADHHFTDGKLQFITECDYPVYMGREGCCQLETIKQGIKYIHELQNLYFALTGAELTIKNHV